MPESTKNGLAAGLLGRLAQIARRGLGADSPAAQDSRPGQAPAGNPEPPSQEAKLLAQARALNAGLMADIHAIPEDEWQRVEKQILGFCNQREFHPDYIKGWMRNRFRLYLMIKWMEKIVPPGSQGLVGLELGGITPATDLLNYYFPTVQWLNTTGDLRFPWQQAPASADVLVCTELLEHVSDVPEGFSDSFEGSGLKAVLAQSFRALKPGGALLITTPNGGSIFHLDKTLHGLPPWFYVLHVREYTIQEMAAELRAAGFQIELCRSVHCLTVDDHMDYTPIFQMLLTYGYPTADRGDDIFIIARKP